MATKRSYTRPGASRRAPRRAWLTLIAAVLCVVGLILILTSLGRMVVNVLNGAGASGGHDPMFAEEAESVTRPPSMTDDPGAKVSGDDDPSRSWEYDTLTPLTPEGYAASEG